MLLKDMNSAGFFEGTEKLLEIWFDIPRDSTEDLKSIPRFELDNLLKIVNAEIVSCTQNEFTNSYVLSESSMFISRNRFIIKTCGITKLLYAVQPIIDLAEKYCLASVENFFYSRRVYLRPDEQHGVHKGFGHEVDFLRQIIPDGNPFIFGSKEEEQWYLFSKNQAESITTPSDDITLEILMSDLDEETMRNFTKERYATSKELVENTGISWLVPGSLNDGLIFDPIGYSLNGLFEEFYYTIHVTPQPMCSYVSFETNLQQEDFTNLINRVVSTFKPGKFIITLFSNKNAPCGSAKQALEHAYVHDYICHDEHTAKLESYSLAYRSYYKS